MNLRDLEYLVALEEEKHFRKAAERCFVSQPTLSGQLRKLEDELGVILIERTSRKVLFTPAGDAMAQQARKVLKEVRELKSIGQHFAEPMSGEIHIGFIPTVGPYLLPHIIQDLREHFPKLEFYLYEEQTQVLLKRL
ncbi:LysR family transcriptional regulator, partial [Aeromonas dhakensis]